ncbi:DNA-binding transcriptional repressor AcrR [Oxobacter pfennigii]|uniref:DNA-binding transcriptional repressor AcrR n=1 Tax=Oxobacter pfennigii TaxID=36849 RepID=A0A0P8WPN0_9CLOT|nr:TetR/AcrR family transcriptional regulator [Oxobacter pfennigii]KPU44506.1 DNA-binding transcriptional repressor AcrR [Oxobacter pfennigii]
MSKSENMYKKGIDTRNKVMSASKKLFYHHGYNSTTINMIKEEAEVSLSTIPYYFNKKDDIIKEIYNTFMLDIYSFLDGQNLKDTDSYLKHFYASKIYYYIILNDHNNKRFYYEVSMAQSNYELLSPFVGGLHLNYIRDFNITVSDSELNLIRMADAGARREILYQYYNNDLTISIDEFINYVTSIVGTLMGIDKSVSQKYGELSTQYVNTLDYSHIKFLI